MWTTFVVIFISVARISAGIHWPSDILGGAVLGIIIGLLVHSKNFSLLIN